MDEKNLTKISEGFFGLTMQVHKKILKLEDFMKDFPIPPSHVKVIFYLTQKGPSPVSVIAKELCISKSNMTPIIDKLLEDGYVIRYEDPNDRRILRIEITEKASEVFKLKREYAIKALMVKLSNLEDTDLIHLSESIKTFTDVLSKLP